MPADLSRDTIHDALLRRRAHEKRLEEAQQFAADFRAFVAAAWPVLEPATPMASGFHLDAICEHLQAVARGEIRRLVINVPPRHGKSLLASIMLPAWWWTWQPTARFLTVSYGSSLAEKNAQKSRDLLRSLWYLERWPTVELKADVNRTSRYENTATGVRVATGVGGEATGEGGDVIIIDDPVKLEDAHRPSVHETVLDWHDGTLGTRFNNPASGREILIMQRLHEDDLAGHLIDRSYDHLCLPARYEPHHPFVWPNDPRTTEGEPLWPDHIPDTVLKEQERQLGSFRAAGQLQQRPHPAEGGLIKRSWWEFFPPEQLAHDKIGLLPQFDVVVSSWDTAVSTKTTADFTCGQLWGIKGADSYLLRSYRRHASLQETIAAIIEFRAWAQERWPKSGHATVVEHSANAPEILLQLKGKISGLTSQTVSTDKIARAVAAALPVEAGNVYLPGASAPNTPAGYTADPWISDFIEELTNFPGARNDDQVDAFSQALNWAAAHAARYASIPIRLYPQNQSRSKTPHARGYPNSRPSAFDTPDPSRRRRRQNPEPPGDQGPIARVFID